MSVISMLFDETKMRGGTSVRPSTIVVPCPAEALPRATTWRAKMRRAKTRRRNRVLARRGLAQMAEAVRR